MARRLIPWAFLFASLAIWLADHSVDMSATGHHNHDDDNRSPMLHDAWANSVIRPSGFHREDAPTSNSTREGSPPYFEGMYVKVTDDSGLTLAFIVGAFYGRAEAHAFILTLDEAGRARQFKFPLSEFHASSDVFDMRIGANSFSSAGMVVDLEGVATGRLTFEGTTPWPITLVEPGVMGWFAWLPAMECRHVVDSMTHTVRGSLQLPDGTTAVFSADEGGGARGYIEGDRGQQFPSHWVWLQTNGFRAVAAGSDDDDDDGPSAATTTSSSSSSSSSMALTSLTGSIAHIPYLGLSFPGHIVGLLHRGRLYRFTTYTGAATTALAINSSTVEWQLEDARHGLRVVVDRTTVPAGDGGDLLWGPRSGDRMVPYVRETLGATISVRLYEKSHPWQAAEAAATIFAGEGGHAGLEVMATAEDLSFAEGAAAARALRAVQAATPLGNPVSAVLLVVATFMALMAH